ncbi:MAG: CDP-alcohol phosphatidyltransferase family protein [Bacteroidota bacterium]
MKQRYYLAGYNLADWLSIYRIISFPVLLYFVLMGQRELFSWFLLASFFTDAIDGFIARKLHIESETGAKLDSVGDTLTLVISVTGLLQFEWAFITEHAIALSTLVSLYLLEMLLSYIRFGKASSFHTYLDKVSLFMQALLILSLLFIGYNPWIFYAALITGFASTIEEIILVFSLDKYRTNIKGLLWLDKHKLRSFN